MGMLELQELSISYGEKPIVRDLNLTVKDGEIISLLGPSGVGKTTILKAIAGLLQPASGRIVLDGECINHLPAEKRDTVLVFQKPLLFPFLDVGRNIGFGLKMAKMKRSLAEKRIDRILEITGLNGLKNQKIHQLSGGQQQRVALARGLVLEPSVLLLDEPLSNLDAGLRQQMRELICRVQEQTGTTMLFVTHDQSEAFEISDRICLLLDGGLRQIGSPTELFYQPKDIEVARFFGCTNFVTGKIDAGVFMGDFVSKPTTGKNSPLITATIRPEDIILSETKRDNSTVAKIQKIQFEGSISRLTLSTDNNTFTVLSLHPYYQKNQSVWLHFPADKLHIFPRKQMT